MLDIKYVRQYPELVERNARNKGYDIDVSQIIRMDQAVRDMQGKGDKLRTRRNEIAANSKQSRPTHEQIEEGKTIKLSLLELDDELRDLELRLHELLITVPNMVLESVPIGKTEDENVVIKTVGDKPKFSFTPKLHSQIAEAKDWLDGPRAVRISGARFMYIKGDLARLEFALWQYGIDQLSDQAVIDEIIAKNNLTVSNRPFTFVLPPAAAKQAVFTATGRLNKHDQTYKIEDEDLWLNASAEHTLSPMYLGEILEEAKLPIRLLGYTTAFRREAGTYGKDTDGMFRLHQFNKLEMETFSTAETSLDEHLFLVAVQEHLMTQLGLPYRVLEKCTADVGRPNAKGVDIDVWLPGQSAYRETHTADYLTDFQARAMKTRVRKTSGELEFVHTNDATAFSERPLIALIENFQTSDGDVIIPETLRPYMGSRDKI